MLNPEDIEGIKDSISSLKGCDETLQLTELLTSFNLQPSGQTESKGNEPDSSLMIVESQCEEETMLQKLQFLD